MGFQHEILDKNQRKPFVFKVSNRCPYYNWLVPPSDDWLPITDPVALSQEIRWLRHRRIFNTEQFKTPERFMQINGNIVVLPVPAEKQDLAYLPDSFETGERVQTPRGSFQVTAMSREQMEAAGYGVHHISDDGKYLIMGNGTRAFAVAAEQPEKDNPLRTAEMTLEDDYGMIDGVINNGRRGEELEKAQEYAERTTPEKPSIRERLEDAKRECAEHKPPEGKKPGRDVPEHDCL